MRIGRTDAQDYSSAVVQRVGFDARAGGAVAGEENTKAQTGEQQRVEGTVSLKAVGEAVDKANKLLSGTNRSIQYSVHKKTKEIVVSVIDDTTKEVIKEIPSKKILDLVASFMEIAGLMMDEKR